MRAGRELVFLQATIEPPNHPLGDLDGVALLVVGGKELMDEAFGMNPAPVSYTHLTLPTN